MEQSFLFRCFAPFFTLYPFDLCVFSIIMGQDISLLGGAFEAAKKAVHFDPSSVEMKDAKQLPMEDGIWVIAIIDSSEDDEPEGGLVVNEAGERVSMRLMAIIDERGMVVGGNAKDEAKMDEHAQSLELLKQCLFAPVVWSPRRPRYVGFRNDNYFTELPLEDVGVQKISMYTGAFGPDDLPTVLEQRRACVYCRGRGEPKLFFLCESCEAVFYCSKSCQVKDFEHKTDDHSHSKWCAKMKQYASISEELTDMPFDFIKETTAVDFNDRCYGAFLKDRGVLSQGFWRWESFEEELPAFGELPSVAHPVILPSEGATLDTAPAEVPPPMGGWEEYYQWRGFNRDSPVAILLQWPMTIYRVLAEYLEKDYPDVKMALDGEETFVIHLVGVEKEADLVPLFGELGHLFPKTKFHLVMIGSEISHKVNGKEGNPKTNVKVTLARGLYDKYKGNKPHLVIGFNAGIAAYRTWGDTLKKLKADRTPAYFTDYCQYSCDCATAPMVGLGLGTITPPAVNPFRAPLRKYCEEQIMPWYSNGFIYRLVYNT